MIKVKFAELRVKPLDAVCVSEIYSESQACFKSDLFSHFTRMMQDVLEANEPIAQPGLIQRMSTSISRVSNHPHHVLTEQPQVTNNVTSHLENKDEDKLHLSRCTYKCHQFLDTQRVRSVLVTSQQELYIIIISHQI